MGIKSQIMASRTRTDAIFANLSAGWWDMDDEKPERTASVPGSGCYGFVSRLSFALQKTFISLQRC